MVSYNQLIDWQNNDESGDITYPVTVDEVKVRAGIEVDYAANDDLISSLIVAATDKLEGKLNVGFRQRSITVVLNNANGNGYLPFAPIGDIEEVIVCDEVLTEDDYEIIGLKSKQLVTKFDRVQLTYTAGYDVLPDKYKKMLLDEVWKMYDSNPLKNV